MTQVGKVLMDEGRREESKKNAKNMLKRGDAPQDIAAVLELPPEAIKAWEKECFATV